jgi:hypothetical protein
MSQAAAKNRTKELIRIIFNSSFFYKFTISLRNFAESERCKNATIVVVAVRDVTLNGGVFKAELGSGEVGLAYATGTKDYVDF